MLVNRGVFKQFRSLINKTFKSANKSQNFLIGIAHEFQATLIHTPDSKQPDYIIASYLIQQLQPLRSTASKFQHASHLIHQFFRALSVPINPKDQIQFEEILKSLLQLQGQFNDIPNIWKQQTKSYECYCDNEEGVSSKDGPPEQLCYRCGRRCHTGCFWAKEKTQRYFQCPVCYLTYCLPHKPVDQIFFLGYLQQDYRQKITHKIRFYLNMNRLDTSNIQIRSVRLDQQNRFELTFPQNCTINVGTKILGQFAPLANTSPLKRRNDQQVHIDKYELNYLNTLFIKEYPLQQYTQHSSQKKVHLIMIVSAKPNFNPLQIQLNFMNERLSCEQSKQMLQSYMTHYHNECVIQKINVSLQCQYFGTNIINPARSRQCTTHYQPFDLGNFIQASLNSRNSVQKWRCPICKKRAYDLVIDDYLMSLIRSQGNISDISFNNDAEPVFIKKEPSEIQADDTYRNQSNPSNDASAKKQKQAVSVIEIDDSNQNEECHKQIVLQLIQQQFVGKQPRELDSKINNIENQRINVIEICDSDEQVQEQQKNTRNLKRTLDDRPQVLQELLQADKLRKITHSLSNSVQSKYIIASPIINPIIQPVLEKPSQTLQQLNNSTKQIQIDTIKEKFMAIFSSKPSAQLPASNKDYKDPHAKDLSIDISVQNPLNRLSTTSSSQLQNSFVSSNRTTKPITEQQVEEDDKIKHRQQILIEQQKMLLDQARKTLRKGPLTRLDQLTFNIICRQISNFKISS